jgi:hypothetical protein
MYYVDDPMGNYPMCFDTAKQCTIIAVDEIITISCGNWDLGNGKFDVVQYWHEVKHEIEKL